MKQSPLAPLHERLSARMSNDGGWSMPQQYTNLINEHIAARASCAVFDISHFGKFLLTGKGALAWLEQHLSNDIASCRDGALQQTLMLREDGAILDRFTLMRENSERFLLIGSVSLADSDYKILSKELQNTSLQFTNETDRLCIIALSGPDSRKVLARVFYDTPIPAKGTFHQFRHGRMNCILSHADLSGSGSLEIFCPAASGISLFEQCMAAGAVPCGILTRNYLRISRGYGDAAKDFQKKLPASAGLSHLCSRGKNYTGSDSVNTHQPAEALLIPLRCHSQGHTPTVGSKVQNEKGEIIGKVTSAAPSPGAHSYAMAYVKSPYAEAGTKLQVICDGQKVPATVAEKEDSEPTA
ncbi:MAG: aminomethyltransferase family protein [Akkermansia sp.]|nr:aminomethyltransferase family protein [Akkermansia sp.]